MKTLLFILTLSLPVLLWGQENQENNISNDTTICVPFFDSLTQRQVFKTTNILPAIEGGNKMLFSEMKKIIIPSNNKSNGGKAVVAFIIEADGQLTGKRIIRNIEGTDIGQQILKLLDNLKWSTGHCNGKAVSVLYTLPVIIDTR